MEQVEKSLQFPLARLVREVLTGAADRLDVLAIVADAEVPIAPPVTHAGEPFRMKRALARAQHNEIRTARAGWQLFEEIGHARVVRRSGRNGMHGMRRVADRSQYMQ